MPRLPNRSGDGGRGRTRSRGALADGKHDSTAKARPDKKRSRAYAPRFGGITSDAELLKARILRWVTVDEDTGCLLWEGAKGSGGYPQLNCWVEKKKKRVTVTRLAYALWKGSIAEGLVIGHSCHRPLCVRPEHLQPMTQSQNRQQAEDRKRVNVVLDNLRFVPPPKPLTAQLTEMEEV